MIQPMMTEAARQAPQVVGEMMKPMVIGAGGYAAARVLTTNPALSFLRTPLLVFAAGVTTWRIGPNTSRVSRPGASNSTMWGAT